VDTWLVVSLLSTRITKALEMGVYDPETLPLIVMFLVCENSGDANNRNSMITTPENNFCEIVSNNVGMEFPPFTNYEALLQL
jgi:hypothetical protein